MTSLGELRELLRRTELTRRLGVVSELHGLAIHASGPRGHVGELCAIVAPGRPATIADLTAPVDAPAPVGSAAAPVLAEIVGIHPGQVTLMPYGSIQGLTVGSTVVALGDRTSIGVGDALMGRVIDGFGRPLDGDAPPDVVEARALKGAPMNPMRRPRITRVLETGISSIDALLTIGQGQRVGIFAGSGVGKSTLLGMIARHVKADVNVIALIGERGREVRDFIEKQLGPEGLKRTVVVVATADQPALARIRAAHAALAVAEHFRDQGRQVLLTMDSITRYAMARREVGLSAGEPPTARGYTPSVFAELPELCERCGTAASGGSISALFTVLVEGDDLNEPVSDALRAVLDGHVVLSRQIANQGLYPAIDLLKSASRLLPELSTPAERDLIHGAIRTLAILERNRHMVELGAYEKGSSPELDAALACHPALQAWLRQAEGGIPRSDSLRRLAEALAPLATASELAPASAPRGTPGAAQVARAAVAPVAARPAAAPVRPAAAKGTAAPSAPAQRPAATPRSKGLA
jgi:flagellum-specific ATP synthase